MMKEWKGAIERLPQHTYLRDRDKHNLFDEWMDSIECLGTFMTDKPTDMEVDEEAKDYIDEDPTVLMLRGEGTYWEPLPSLKPLLN